MKKSLKIGAYLRVSTDRQVQVFEGSLDTQKYRLQEFVKNRNKESKGWGEVIEFYIDEGLSAGTDKRPQYRQLLADVRSGKINLILVADISRLSRSVHDFSVLLRELEQFNASFLSMKEQFDTTTPAGRLMINMVVNMAQFEREQTSERVSINFNSRALRGFVNGGPTPFGFDREKDKPGTFVINPIESEEVRTIFRLFKEHGSVPKIIPVLESLGLERRATDGDDKNQVSRKWNYPALRDILTNPAYAGLKEVNRKYKAESPENLKPWEHYSVVKASWKSIIDQETFEETQRMLEENLKLERRRLAGAERRIFLLSGILCCGECGRALCGQSSHGKIQVHRYYAHSYKLGEESKCSLKRIRADEVEQVVLNHFLEVAGRAGYFDEIEGKLSETLKDVPRHIDGEVDKVKKQLNETEQEITSTFRLQLRVSGGTEAAALTAEHLEKLGRQKKVLVNRLDELEEMKIVQQDSTHFREVLETKLNEFKKGLPKASPANKRRLLRRVLGKLVFTAKSKGIEVHFNFEEGQSARANQPVAPSETGKVLNFKGKQPAKPRFSGADSALSLSSEFLLVCGNGWGGRTRTCE